MRTFARITFFLHFLAVSALAQSEPIRANQSQSEPIRALVPSLDKTFSVALGDWPASSKKMFRLEVVLPVGVVYTPTRVDSDCGCVRVMTNGLGKPQSVVELDVVVSDKGEAGSVDRLLKVFFKETGSTPLQIQIKGRRLGRLQFERYDLDFSTSRIVRVSSVSLNPQDAVKAVSSLTGLTQVGKFEAIGQKLSFELASDGNTGTALERLQITFADGTTECHNFLCQFQMELAVLPRLPEIWYSPVQKSVRIKFHLINKTGFPETVGNSKIPVRFKNAKGDFDHLVNTNDIQIRFKGKNVAEISIETSDEVCLKYIQQSKTEDTELGIVLQIGIVKRLIPCLFVVAESE